MKTKKRYSALLLLLLLLPCTSVFSFPKVSQDIKGICQSSKTEVVIELQSQMGPDHGKFRSMIFDPLNEGVIYASSYNGAHIMQSTDNGQNWSFLYSIPMPGSDSCCVKTSGSGEKVMNERAQISQLRFANPDEPSHLYALVRKPEPGSFSENGLLYILNVKTGELINTVGVDSDEVPFFILNYDICQKNPQKMVISGNVFGKSGSVWQTNDGGETWDMIYDNEDFEHRRVTLVQYHPDNSDVILAGVGNSHLTTTGGIMRSDDGGNTWSFVFEEDDQCVDKIVWHPDGAIFALTVRLNDEPDLLVSHDHGVSWDKIDLGLELPDEYSFRFNDLAIHPQQNDIMWITGSHHYFLKTADSGNSWEYVAFPEEEYGPDFYYFGREIAVNPFSGDHMVVLPGRYAIQSFDKGNTWELLPNKMTRIRSMNTTAYPNGETYLYYTTLGSYHVKNLNSGEVNEHIQTTLRFSGYSIIGDPYSESRSFMGQWSGGVNGLMLYESKDHFETPPKPVFSSLDKGLSTVIGTPEQDGVYWIVAGERYNNFFRTTDAFSSYERLGFITGEMTTKEEIRALRVVENEPGVLWAAANGNFMKGVYRTDDHGDSWALRSSGLPFGQDILTLDIHPEDADVLIAAADNNAGLYKTTDGGLSWFSVLEGYDFLSVLFSQHHPNFVLAQPSEKAALYYSLDGGLHWKQLPGEAFLEAEYTSMDIVEDENGIDIYYGTNGAGILHYRMNITEYFSVKFIVEDTNGQEINDAIVVFDGETHDPGHYYYEHITTGTYPFVVSREDYYDYEGTVTVKDQDIEATVVLEEASSVNVPGISNTEWIVFPNPANTYVRIEPGIKIDRLDVYDLLGRTVYSSSAFDTGTGKIYVGEWPNGMYFLRAVMPCGEVSTVRFKVSKRQ